MRILLALTAALAMASPAWACVIGEPGWLDKCDKEFAGPAETRTFVWTQNGGRWIDTPTIEGHPDVPTNGSTYSTGSGLTIPARKSRVVKPKVVSEDYRLAMCDLGRLTPMALSDRQTVTIRYDDGTMEFDCARDVREPK